MEQTKAKTTAKDFFLWAGAIIALYWSVVAFLGLMFDYVNYAFPNSLDYATGDPYQGGISYEMASVIVLFPIFLILMKLIRREAKKDSSRNEIWVRRWAIFLTLFLAGLAMVIDVVVLLTSFLNGTDLTIAFLFKVALVLLVAAGIFMHFLAESWGYWIKNPRYARDAGLATSLLIICTVIAGFFIVGTPMHAREVLLDDNKISDLQNIQYQVVDYWQDKQMLPATLADLNDDISGFEAPLDAQTGMAYEYSIMGSTTFQLCATFNTDNYTETSDTYGDNNEPMMPATVGGNEVSDNWLHGPGKVCFTRTIDPSRYPATPPSSITGAPVPAAVPVVN